MIPVSGISKERFALASLVSGNVVISSCFTIFGKILSQLKNSSLVVRPADVVRSCIVLFLLTFFVIGSSGVLELEATDKTCNQSCVMVIYLVLLVNLLLN